MTTRINRRDPSQLSPNDGHSRTARAVETFLDRLGFNPNLSATSIAQDATSSIPISDSRQSNPENTNLFARRFAIGFLGSDACPAAVMAGRAVHAIQSVAGGRWPTQTTPTGRIIKRQSVVSCYRLKQESERGVPGQGAVDH